MDRRTIVAILLMVLVAYCLGHYKGFGKGAKDFEKTLIKQKRLVTKEH